LKTFSLIYDHEAVTDIEETLNNGYIFTISPGYITKVDKRGNIEWSKYFGLSVSSIKKFSNNYFILGDKWRSGENNNLVLMSIDENGNII